jgi:hypothetical protein
MSREIEQTVFGISPLGGNSVDGATIEGVPLVYDSRVGNYISEQAVEELNDREISEQAAAEYEREQLFRTQAGFRRL